MGSSSIQKLKKWYHFTSTKSEIKCIYSSVQQSKQQGYATNYATATLLKCSCQYFIGGKLQASYSSPAVRTSPSSGLTWSPSAHAWHCCPPSCFHSGPQQLPAEGFGWLGPRSALEILLWSGLFFSYWPGQSCFVEQLCSSALSHAGFGMTCLRAA